MEDDCGIADAIASSIDRHLTTVKQDQTDSEKSAESVVIRGEVFDFGDLGNFGVLPISRSPLKFVQNPSVCDMIRGQPSYNRRRISDENTL